jgi:hypothetical protein
VRKIELPKGRFADIAEEDDLTVQEQWDIEHAGIASESVSAHTTILQLEELRTLEAALPDAARTLEAELTAIVAAPKTGPVRRREAQERLKLMSDARATTALALAYQKLGPEEYAPIDRYEVVRVMCFLRSWDVPGPDGQPIPIPADRSPASVAAFAAVAPNSAMKVISAETVKTNTAPADFERSQDAGSQKLLAEDRELIRLHRWVRFSTAFPSYTEAEYLALPFRKAELMIELAEVERLAQAAERA